MVFASVDIFAHSGEQTEGHADQLYTTRAEVLTVLISRLQNLSMSSAFKLEQYYGGTETYFALSTCTDTFPLPSSLGMT